MPQALSDAPNAVRVSAPARLHLGFLDLEGGLGRRFGSLGLAIEGFATDLELRRGENDRVSGDEAERAAAVLARLRQTVAVPPVTVEVGRSIPAHAGLGSGTQLGLAVGVGLAALHRLSLGPAEVAARLGRGTRSGIGVGVFACGGFLLDGGSAGDGVPPPIIARLDFPPEWRLLLILDRARAGLHGQEERRAFGGLRPFPAELAGRLCRLVVMRLLPGLAAARLEEVGSALGELQRRVGDHFAPAQGARFASPAVGEVLAWLEAAGVAGVGQSSWGPTGFALLPDEVTAVAFRADALRRFAGSRPELDFVVTQGRNRGAEIALLS